MSKVHIDYHCSSLISRSPWRCHLRCSLAKYHPWSGGRVCGELESFSTLPMICSPPSIFIMNVRVPLKNDDVVYVRVLEVEFNEAHPIFGDGIEVDVHGTGIVHSKGDVHRTGPLDACSKLRLVFLKPDSYQMMIWIHKRVRWMGSPSLCKGVVWSEGDILAPHLVFCVGRDIARFARMFFSMFLICQLHLLECLRW